MVPGFPRRPFAPSPQVFGQAPRGLVEMRQILRGFQMRQILRARFERARARVANRWPQTEARGAPQAGPNAEAAKRGIIGARPLFLQNPMRIVAEWVGGLRGGLSVSPTKSAIGTADRRATKRMGNLTYQEGASGTGALPNCRTSDGAWRPPKELGRAEGPTPASYYTKSAQVMGAL